MSNDDYFAPAFSENIDLKITDRCDGGCAFCYEGCTENGAYGELLNNDWVDSLHPYTELAINGNDMTHPQLNEFLEKLKQKQVFCNMTVNQKHFEGKFEQIKELVDKKLIYGVGVSLVTPTDSLVEKMSQLPNIVLHTINGVVTAEQIDKLKNKNIKLLILGYKEMQRGVKYKEEHLAEIEANQRYLRENIVDIYKGFNCLSFDNLALQQLDVKRYMSEESWDNFFMGVDGGYTFYLDACKQEFSLNSVAPVDKRYSAKGKTVDEMFQIINKQK